MKMHIFFYINGQLKTIFEPPFSSEILFIMNTEKKSQMLVYLQALGLLLGGGGVTSHPNSPPPSPWIYCEENMNAILKGKVMNSLFSSCLHVSYGIRNPVKDCGENKSDVFVMLETFIHKMSLHWIGLQNYKIYPT